MRGSCKKGKEKSNRNSPVRNGRARNKTRTSEYFGEEGEGKKWVYGFMVKRRAIGGGRTMQWENKGRSARKTVCR